LAIVPSSFTGVLTSSTNHAHAGKIEVNGGTLAVSADTHLGAVTVAAVADKITLNTHVLKHNPELIDQAARTFGSQAVVLALEAKRWNGWWECYSDCGRERSGKDVIAWVQEAERRGAGEVLVQSVDCDGRRQGFDIPLLHAVKQAVAIPMIAASGAGSVGDVVTMARQVRPDAVAIASLLHYELATIVELKAALAEEGL
jgi:cyclase